MIARTVSRTGLWVIWAAVVIIGAVSPLIDRNYELIGAHWVSWSIGAALLTGGYLLSSTRYPSWVDWLPAVGMVLLSVDIVATLTAALVMPNATSRGTQPIANILTSTGCGTTIAMAAATVSLIVGIASWLGRQIAAGRDARGRD